MRMALFFRALLAMCLALPGALVFAQAQDFYTDCEKFPDSLSCMPTGDAPAPEQVPSRTEQITQQAGPVFGGGACPANLNVAIAGQSITVLNMGTPCAVIVDYVRPVFLLLAAISAVFIILPTED